MKPNFLLFQLGFAVFAFVEASVLTPRVPYETIKTTNRFTIGSGYAGDPSMDGKALRELLQGPGPVAHCQMLLTHGTPTGQLYGLLGLRLLDPQAFKAAIPRYTSSTADVLTMNGGIIAHIPVAMIARSIEEGEIR